VRLGLVLEHGEIHWLLQIHGGNHTADKLQLPLPCATWLPTTRRATPQYELLLRQPTAVTLQATTNSLGRGFRAFS